MAETTQEARHYRWEDLPRDHPMEHLARRRIIGERMMLSEVFLERGCQVPGHAHENEQIACILEGNLRFFLGSQDRDACKVVDVRAGEVLHLPSNVFHAAEALEDTLVLDVFSPVSETTGIDQKR